MTYDATASGYEAYILPEITSTRELGLQFGAAFPDYIKEVLLALLPILLFFLVFQIFFLHLRKKQIVKILVGLLYTFIGLTLFLTGVNVGFMPVGNFLGAELAKLPYNWILIPLGMLIGYFIVKAEPAVLVLNKQVEDITSGAISQRVMMVGLSVGMALSVGLSMLRVLTGLPLLWLLIPGYMLALGLSFVVPPIFTAIAFDLGGNMLTDAFGIVAMVAMTPLIIIQIIGLIYKCKTGGWRRKKPVQQPVTAEDEIISLDEEEARL